MIHLRILFLNGLSRGSWFLSVPEFLIEQVVYR